MQIHVTEHKSAGQPRANSLVRVFVNEDYHYGYFVDEQALFNLLDNEQQLAYTQSGDEVKLDVCVEVAQKIVDIGQSPYAKPKLA